MYCRISGMDAICEEEGGGGKTLAKSPRGRSQKAQPHPSGLQEREQGGGGSPTGCWAPKAPVSRLRELHGSQYEITGKKSTSACGVVKLRSPRGGELVPKVSEPPFSDTSLPEAILSQQLWDQGP